MNTLDQGFPCTNDGVADIDALWARYCDTREQAVRNLLAAEYLYIAEIVARRYAGRGIEYDDLFQVASLALIKAIDRFDCTYGVRFATYATPTIVGEVKNHFRDRLRLLRIPRRSSEMLKLIEEAREALAQQLGRMPRTEELAERLNLDISDVLEVMESGVAANITSLDQPVEEEDGVLLERVGLEDPALEAVINNDFLMDVIKTLSPFERTILSQRYQERRSQRDIAAEHNVSQMYISNLERKLLNRFRQKLT